MSEEITTEKNETAAPAPKSKIKIIKGCSHNGRLYTTGEEVDDVHTQDLELLVGRGNAELVK